MEFYIFTLLIFSILSFFEFANSIPIKIKYFLFFICFFIFIIQVGFRWETGTDWLPYYRDYYGILTDYDEVYEISATEKGYKYLVNFSKLILTNYTFFLTFHAVIYLGMVFYFIKKFSPYVFCSIIIFYSSTLGIWGSNRQLLALGICLISLIYLYEGKKKHFIFLVLLASIFHSSAPIFFLYYFSNKNFDKKLVIISLILSYIIGQTSLPFNLFSFFGNIFADGNETKIAQYIDFANDKSNVVEVSNIGLIKRIVLLYVITKYYDTIVAKFPKYKIAYNGYFFGLVFYFLFNKSLLVLSSRGSIYFYIAEILLFPFLVTLIKDIKQRSFLAVILFAYAVFSSYRAIDIYPDLFDPYKGVFYNTNFKRNVR